MKANIAEIKERSRLSAEEWREYTKTVWHIANVSDPSHPAVFPEEIPKRLIKLFSFCDEIVLDPFCGTGTTLKVALNLERNAIGIEQNQDFARIINDRLESIEHNQDNWFQLINGDSRRMAGIDNDSVGLVITSPPYWNKANYGDSKANLGNIGNYSEFFREIRPVFEECYRVLQPGRKLCVVTANVNQQTNHGLLTFPLSTDFATLLREIGFVMINEVIWSKDGTGGKWGSANGQRPIFGSYPFPPNFLFKNVHEYILIFAKPSGIKRTGPKVQNYEQHMELPIKMPKRDV